MIGTALVLVLAGAPSLRVGSEHHFLEPGLAVQGRLTMGTTLGGESTATAELRRLRFSLRGSAGDGRLTFGVQLNTTPAALELLDLWLGFSPTPGVTLKAGQLKTPFTRHRAGSFQTLPLVDWSLAAVHFGAERQLGLLLALRRGHSRSAFGVFSGTNARASFARGVAELYGVPLVNRSDFRVEAPPEPIHPELFARTGFALTDTKVKASAFVSAAWDLRPTPGVDFQLRLAPELELGWRTLTLELLGYAGWAPARDGALIATSLGATAELSWRLQRRWLLAVRWSRVELLPAARLDALASGDGTRPIAAAQQELATAVTLKLLGVLRLQLEGAWLHALSDEARVRVQLQLAL